MSEGKKNIIASLIEEYDIQTAEDIQDALRDLLGGTLHNMKALYLSTLQAIKKWSQPLRNWGQVYGEFSIMYEGRIPL